MPNQINRDIYVLSNKIKNPVDYVQGTDALNIIFKFRDFEIPDASEAQVFVSKPSGKAVYNTAVITGNTVTVNTTPEMFSEIGNTELQINIRNNSELLTSFIQPVMVQKNLSFHGESGNESDFFEEYIEKIDTAISKADTATDSANAAASDANSAASDANDAAEDIRQKAESGEFSATVKVGTVTASEPGGDAEVTNTGTAQDAVFNFVLPRGEQGPKGNKGDKGDTGAIENIDGVSVDFSTSSTRQNIATGDTFSTLFGKIAKWFSDLGTAAFQGVSNVLTQTSSGYVLDARQGKTLADRIGTLSSLLTAAKTSLVSAVNELFNKIGDLDNLNTTEKDDIVGAINETNASLSQLSSNKGIINASAESNKKTLTTSAWGAVIHSIILPEAGTYLVGADYAGTNVCFVSSGGGNKYLMPGGTALVTVDGYTVVDFKSNTSLQAVWTEFLPFYIRLM